eukprot:3183857-Pyramimonas_sp.AAC.1
MGFAAEVAAAEARERCAGLERRLQVSEAEAGAARELSGQFKVSGEEMAAQVEELGRRLEAMQVRP